MTDVQPHFPCCSCGHLVFTRPPGSGQSCPVCEWRDDVEPLEFATTLANEGNELTLFEAQCVGAPDRPDIPSDPDWRPIDMAVDEFEDCHEPDPRRAPPDDPLALYYWRPSFWRRGP